MVWRSSGARYLLSPSEISPFARPLKSVREVRPIKMGEMIKKEEGGKKKPLHTKVTNLISDLVLLVLHHKDVVGLDI